MVVVIMGVSGSGKTTIGMRLALLLGARFAEGDDFHSPANIEKMRAGIALDDSDRKPWLEALRDRIGVWLETGENAVLACSALRQSYRDILKDGRDGVYFVHLRGEEALIRARLELRRGHYMPPTLLTSQVQTLEEPKDAIVVDIGGEPDPIVQSIAAALRAQERPGTG